MSFSNIKYTRRVDNFIGSLCIPHFNAGYILQFYIKRFMFSLPRKNSLQFRLYGIIALISMFFYEKAKKSRFVLATGEKALYANVIIKKGVTA